MADQTLIILAEQAFHAALLETLERDSASQAITLKAVSTRSELSEVVNACTDTTRLAAFCTDVIVPAAILQNCDAGAYNFHPGPPEYPGIFPSCFAIFDEATSFGATAHRMTEKVDEGEIVGATRFSIPPKVDRLQLDGLAFNAVSSLFREMTPKLLDLSNALEPCGLDWAGPVRTRAHFRELCQLPENVSGDEFELRYRAVGEGPDHALTLQVHGHRFKLDNLRDQDSVVRGGQQSPTETE